MSDEQTTDAHGLTRRQALAAAAALCGFGAAAVAGTGVAQASGTLRVRLSKYPALRKVGGIALVGELGSTPVAVVRTARNSYIALNRRCPHAGVAVTPRGRGFVCLPPGHGSVFTDTGARVSGPAPTGLSKLSSTLNRGVLTITG
jgi:cytochrome b6-f complex iron-sulfur subunit